MDYNSMLLLFEFREVSYVDNTIIITSLFLHALHDSLRKTRQPSKLNKFLGIMTQTHRHNP
ncbi:hypothetical protein GBA52_017835 [Prunus armeniaca]|nr:hypothetical protein GBA52_017835 [Prunus armeniaca]